MVFLSCKTVLSFPFFNLQVKDFLHFKAQVYEVLMNLFFPSVLSLIIPGLPGHLGQIMPTVRTTTAPSKIASEQIEQKEVTGSF